MKKEERDSNHTDLTNLSKDELLSLFIEARNILKQRYAVAEQELLQREEGIPVEVFANELSPGEAAVKWLKEQGLGYHDIGVKLNRDERGVWGSYRRASRKMPSLYAIKHPETIIPFSVLESRKTSMLEAIVFYLNKSKGIKLIKIARTLNKHPSTIWTVYERARKKLKAQNENN